MIIKMYYVERIIKIYEIQGKQSLVLLKSFSGSLIKHLINFTEEFEMQFSVAVYIFF